MRSYLKKLKREQLTRLGQLFKLSCDQNSLIDELCIYFADHNIELNDLTFACQWLPRVKIIFNQLHFV
jgi:hypothetical protein